MFLGFDIALIAAPIICIKHTYAKWVKQGLQFFENDVFPFSKGIRQNCVGIVVYDIF